jgi:hypothetical protein
MSALLEKLAQIIDESRNRLPVWMLTYVPETADDLRAALSLYLRENASTLQGAGTNFVRALAHALVGMIIGGLISLREATARHRAAAAGGGAWPSAPNASATRSAAWSSRSSGSPR